MVDRFCHTFGQPNNFQLFTTSTRLKKIFFRDALENPVGSFPVNHLFIFPIIYSRPKKKEEVESWCLFFCSFVDFSLCVQSKNVPTAKRFFLLFTEGADKNFARFMTQLIYIHLYPSTRPQALFSRKHCLLSNQAEMKAMSSLYLLSNSIKRLKVCTNRKYDEVDFHWTGIGMYIVWYGFPDLLAALF